MKTPNVGDVVTVIRYVGRPARAVVVRSYKRRFLVKVDEIAHQTYSFERAEKGKAWVCGWDTEEAVAWRAEVALESCR